MSLLAEQPAKPAVWVWYVAYCVAMALLYLFVIGAGIFLLTVDPTWLEEDARLLWIEGFLFIGLGLPLMAAFAIAPFLPKKPWVWIYGIALIGLGMTSACCLPATIPLLIFWIKPETQQFFGRKQGNKT
jgi:hypothetical protein